MNKKKTVIMIAMVVLLIGTLGWYFNKNEPLVLSEEQATSRSSGRPLSSSEGMLQRIQAQIAEIKTLTPDESLADLDQMKFYLWPGSLIYTKAYMANDEGRYKMNSDMQEVILSSRLFRRCFQDLSYLPKKEAAEKINREIEKTLPDYRKAFQEWVDEGGATWLVIHTKTKKPTVVGLRYKLLALTLLAGTLELADCYPKVHSLAIMALEQKNELGRKIEDPRNHDNGMTSVSVLNPVILCNGLCGSDPTWDMWPAMYRLSRNPREIVEYTAAYTEYDRIYFAEPVKSGKIMLPLFEEATDESLQIMLAISSYGAF